MIVAHVSLTPQDGAVWAAAEAFREAGYDSFCVAPDACDGGPAMPTDYRLPPSGGAVARLHQAGVVLCHDPWVRQESWFPRGKAAVGWARSPGPAWHCEADADSDDWPWGVGGAAACGDCPGRPPLPELVPLKHRFYHPASKPAARVKAAYCYGRTGGSRAGLSDPVYEATLAALAGLNADIDVLVGLGLADRLRRMAAAHVVVDDCATGGYGRASLEALAVGCVVVNGCDGLRNWNIHRMTGGRGHPFEVAGLGTLHAALRRLVERGPAELTHMGNRNRQWMEHAWEPSRLIERNFRPLMDTAIRQALGADRQCVSRLAGSGLSDIRD